MTRIEVLKPIRFISFKRNEVKSRQADKSIIVERKKIKDYSSSQLIGPNRTVQRTWEISIRNNKKQAIRLILQDQYPVSREKEIEVELTDAGGAKVNPENGFLFDGSEGLLGRNDSGAIELDPLAGRSAGLGKKPTQHHHQNACAEH